MPERIDKRAQVLRSYQRVLITQNDEAAINIISKHALAFATKILAVTAESREQSVALTKLEEAVMWATAAVLRNAPVEEPEFPVKPSNLPVPVHTPPMYKKESTDAPTPL